MPNSGNVSVEYYNCTECLPDHVEWYETEPAEREARRVADEVAASLNPEVDYVR